MKAATEICDGGVVKVFPVQKSRAIMYRELTQNLHQVYFAPICMDANDPSVVKSAYIKRVLRTVPKPIRNADGNLIGVKANLQDLRSFVAKFLNDNFNKADYQCLSLEQWLDGTDYNEQRKQQMRDAYDRIQLTGGRPSVRESHRIESHIKYESYPCYKHARVINSRPDVFKVWFGPICKSIETVVYRLKNSDGQPYFVKNLIPEERKHRILNLTNNKFIFSTDYTAFESHFTPEIMDCLEFQLYHYFMNESDYEYLKRVIGGRNKMRFRNGFKAECDGRRMSGEMSTSLANGFSNLMIALYLASLNKAHLDGVVEGDDGLFTTDFKLDSKQYLDLGFTIKIKQEERVSEASFCGLIFGSSGNVIKDPFRAFQKFNYTLKYINVKQKVCDELLKAKAMSLLCEAPNCPILGVFTRELLSELDNVSPKFMEMYNIQIDYVLNFDAGQFDCDIETRNLFYRKFGITVELQLRCEEYCRLHDYESMFELLFWCFSVQSGTSWLDSELDIKNRVSDNLDFISKHLVPVFGRRIQRNETIK